MFINHENGWRTAFYFGSVARSQLRETPEFSYEYSRKNTKNKTLKDLLPSRKTTSITCLCIVTYCHNSNNSLWMHSHGGIFWFYRSNSTLDYIYRNLFGVRIFFYTSKLQIKKYQFKNSSKSPLTLRKNRALAFVYIVFASQFLIFLLIKV